MDESLSAEIADLKRKIAAIDRQEKTKETAYKSTPEWKKIQAEQKAISKEQSEIHRRRTTLNKKLGAMVSDQPDRYFEGEPAIYYRRSGWGNNSVKQEVLDAIALHIGPLSHLTDTQIEEITGKIYGMAKRRNVEYAALTERGEDLRAREEQLYEEERDIERASRTDDEASWPLRQRLTELEFKRDHPDTAKTQDRRAATRAKIPIGIPAVYNAIFGSDSK